MAGWTCPNADLNRWDGTLQSDFRGTTITPVEPADIVNKEYVDEVSINTGIDLFAYNSASDTGTYKQFKLTPSAGAEVESIVNVLGNATAQAVGARITEVGIDCEDLINTLTTGVYNFHVQMKAATAGRISFYAEFYVRAAGGTETLLATTAETETIGTSQIGYDTHAEITTEHPLTAGDRLVVKAYAKNSSPAATNLYVYVEGDTATRVSIRGLSAPRLHSSLGNLAYADAGHTGFQPTLPAGLIQMYGAATAPTGWVLCNGASLLRAGTYAALFAVIGVTYGSVDGTHFNVPDMRGIFPRGAGTSGKLSDANGAAFTGTLGTYQNDKSQGHAHNLAWYNGVANSAGGNTHYIAGQSGAPHGIWRTTQNSTNTATVATERTDGTHGVPRLGDETNPANLGLTFIIKY